MRSFRFFTAAVAFLTLLGSPAEAQQTDTPSRRDTVELAPVVVTATAPDRLRVAGTSTATKTLRLLRDVPQAVSVVPRRLVLDQAMQSMADVARYIPGVTMGLGEGHRDAPTIRGNSSTADFFLDGVRDDAQYLRDLYDVDRVEALKGPNAMVFGRGGGGGVINRVSKTARWSPTRELLLGGGAYAQKRTSADVGGALSDAVALRLNAMFENSDQFRDFTTIERLGLHPVMAWRLAPNTEVTAGYERFSDRRTVNRGIPAFAGAPSRAPITTFFGDPAVSHGYGLSVRNRTRVARYDKFYQNVYPGAVNTAGTLVSLLGYNNAIYRRNVFNQTDLTYTLGRSGAVRQTLLVGGEIGRQNSENYRNTAYFNDTLTSLQVPFANPTVAAPVTFRYSATDASNAVVATVAALYAQDEITLGRSWQAVVGLRYERFGLDFHNNRTNQNLARTDRKVSPRAGLVFKPAEPVSIYTSYSVSFLPSSGDQFSSLTATTQTLLPERFENSEVGVKWDVRQGLAVTGAAFHLDRTNTTAPDPADASRVVQTGSQRTTGFELSAIGAVTLHWEIAAAFARQRARVVSRTAAAAPGQSVPLVPHVTFSLWNRYDVTSWLGAGLGITHQDRMYAAIDNAVTLPGFTRVDLAAYVTLNRFLRAQINVENVLNERYYPTAHGNNNIMPGAPRSVRVTMNATP
jgi:catecholate siderophore receptor